ncbi:MAG TPA: VIT domain-containing protein [Haliscomenobacter sp.]|uniref:VIT domain-containing protein n=1 Tax=Haliscomenobacter sp. TaxID=2717303 RepID=UPI002C54ED41|nr:VIT domain-containing protein [Haliscomenobacter sp.]HOY18333.1 VIT domain-containing protein [Haliscomenobacter sp.]
MKLLRLYLLIVLGGLSLLRSQAQQFNSLTVLDPQFNWPNYRGTIEEAMITLRPVGLYTEVGVYLTISAKDASFQVGRQLEAVLGFTLPDNAIVNDSWLWIDTTIIRAKILDRWTASTIYENIVQRRQDPSILTKATANQYSLRIYPLIMGDKRKVKINYLVPGNWTTEEVQTVLPVGLLRSGQATPPPLEIRLFMDSPWQNPKLSTHPELNFVPKQDPEVGTYLSALIPPAGLSTREVILSLKAPLKNGVFLSRYGDNQEGYYQMALFPEQMIDFSGNLKPRRILVLLHYNPATALGISPSQLMSEISAQLKRVLQPRDFFNVVLSGVSPKVLANDWISASPTEIDRVFNTLQNENLSSLNLPGLMAKGMEWIKSNGKESKILLFSSSVSEGDLGVSNELIRELSLIKGNTEIPFYIVDYARHNAPNYRINNRNYWGNEYFYHNWSRLTKGDYAQQYYCCSDFNLLSAGVVDVMTTEKADLDLHTSLQSGFCYNRYNLNQLGEATTLRQPILQVGRYQGNWPFVVELSGKYANNLFFNATAVPLTETYVTDSTGADTWAGNYISALERPGSSNNAIAAEIINASIQRRILSYYTAFLCLEPAQGGEPCLSCLDRSQGPLVGTQDLQDSLILSKISPNPFHERVMIQLQFKDLIDLSNAKILVYNHVGQVVRTFSDVPKGKIQNLELQWDGRSDGGAEVPAGMYIFRLQTPTGQYSRKLMKLEN